MKQLPVLKKHILLVFIICVLFFTSCQQENAIEAKLETEEVQQEGYEEDKLQSDVAIAYETLGNIIWNDSMEEVYPLFKSGISQYAKEVAGEFQPVIGKEDIFPAELLCLLQEAFYYSCNDNTLWEHNDTGQENAYCEVINNLEAEKFQLSLEEICSLFPEVNECKEDFGDKYDALEFISGQETCIDLFCIDSAKDGDKFIFVYDVGGSTGNCWVEIAQRINNEFIVLEEFEAKKSGDVIRYAENFYYVCKLYNFNTNAYDGICLYKLGDKPQEENVVIRYLPKEYVWQNIYYAALEYEFDKELDSYIEDIKQELTQNNYIESGKERDIELFWGTELKDEDFILAEEKDSYYKIDMANLGSATYMKKSNMVSAGKWSHWYLKAKFYLYDGENKSALELKNLEIGESAPFPESVKLVQMWFREIHGKVVTFRVYHVSDYNYLFNVVLVEGDAIKQIRNEILSPEREFVLKK